MNWKNAFFLTLAALFVSIYWGFTGRTIKDQDTSELCSTLNVLSIDSDIALCQIDAYNTYLESIEIIAKVAGENAGIGSDNCSIPLQDFPKENRKVKYFQIKHCELNSIIQDAGPDADVKAMLSVKMNEETDSAEIDLIFKVTQEGGTEGPDSKYFDFSMPCPPVCPPVFL